MSRMINMDEAQRLILTIQHYTTEMALSIEFLKSTEKKVLKLIYMFVTFLIISPTLFTMVLMTGIMS